ncbi:MAG: MnmC family methyltransferase [archaeon]|nr:MnmC family methyltransferase [archaeon]
MMSYKEDAIVINDTIFDLVNSCFEKEKDSLNKNFRCNFFKENKEFFVKTDDDSYSINSKEINNKVETLHTSSGAISESFEKFIKPLKLDDKEEIAILDICAGLGYNSSAAISEYSDKKSLKIDMVEISHATLACGLLVPSPIKAHDITKKAIEKQLIKENYASLELVDTEIPKNMEINVFIEDARQTVQKLEDNSYDAIFLDPFSQTMAPELFSLEFFKEFKRVIKEDGIVATYTSSAPVRSGFLEAGFHIGKGPVFGRKQGGTLASPTVDVLDYSLPKNDEIRIALSDVGIPFRDPNLTDNSDVILERRTEERHLARHNTKISSAVKTPIFLTCEMEDEKLKRRVERNLNKMNILSTTSKEAFYILECENNYLETQEKDNNSRFRILDMEKRLKKVKNEGL